jgi:hypothetical protein
MMVRRTFSPTSRLPWHVHKSYFILLTLHFDTDSGYVGLRTKVKHAMFYLPSYTRRFSKTQDWARICCACLTARSVTSDLLTLFLSHVYHTIPITWISHHAYYINTLSRLSHNTYLHEKQCVVHTHAHTHTHTYTHIHTHTHTYTYTQTHTHLYTRIFCMLLNRRSWRSLEL